MGERPPADLGAAPLDQAGLLDRFAALRTDARLLVGIDPFDLDAFRRDLQLAEHPAFAGFAVSPFLSGVDLEDEIFAPFLEEIAERGLVLWVHASAHFRADVAYDIGHPRHVDAVAMRYPGLRAIIGHAGWPWTQEACIIALRHASIAIEFSTFPPGLLAKPGHSLSPLLANARSLKGRIFFGSGATFSSQRMGRLLRQLDELSLSGDVEGWRGAALTNWMRLH